MARKEADTNIGGAKTAFPLTEWSAIEALRSPDNSSRSAAAESLIKAYWKPVYKYLRIKWRKSNEDAKDLTQSFFTRAIEKDFFRNYDPAQARFRTFLRTCLEGFVINEEKSAHAQKRGGHILQISLDFHLAEAELKSHSPSPEDCFEKEWIRSLFSIALEELRVFCRETGRETQFLLFEKYDIERDPMVKISYADLASEFKIPVTSVTNHLAFARREFRRIVLQKLREITGSESEFRNETRRLFGVDVS